MNIEDLRTFCLSFPATAERLPFNFDYLVFFVYDKMFCLIDITDPHDLMGDDRTQRARAIEMLHGHSIEGLLVGAMYHRQLDGEGLPIGVPVGRCLDEYGESRFLCNFFGLVRIFRCFFSNTPSLLSIVFAVSVG